MHKIVSLSNMNDQTIVAQNSEIELHDLVKRKIS